MTTLNDESNALVRVLATGSAANGVERAKLANRLADLYNQGANVSSLRTLITSPCKETRKLASFIASEAGPRCLPILDEIRGVLGLCSDSRMADDLVSCVLCCAPPTDGDTAVEAILLLTNEDSRVRYCGMKFALLCPTEMLSAALQTKKSLPRLITEGIYRLLAVCAGTLVVNPRDYSFQSHHITRHLDAVAAVKWLWRTGDAIPLNEIASQGDEIDRQFVSARFVRRGDAT